MVLGLFGLLLCGQAVAGYREHRREHLRQGQLSDSFPEYLTSAHFFEAVFENWESEFLQMSAYVFLTVFLYQKGSAESKDPDRKEEVDEDPAAHAQDAAAPGPVRRGGWRLGLYRHSLGLALFGLFLLSWVGHVWSGAAEYNADLAEHGQPTVSILQYMGSARFWFESLQNWQSEFLAVGSIVVLSIWLREFGSPESKPVAAPHSRTG